MIDTIDAPKLPGIYSIVNKVTGKTYIGSTINLYQRLNGHRTALTRNSSGEVKALAVDYLEYGEDAFSFNVLEILPKDEIELSKREMFYVAEAHESPGGCYNRKNTASRVSLVRKLYRENKIEIFSRESFKERLIQYIKKNNL